MIGMNPGILNLFWVVIPIKVPKAAKMDKNVMSCKGLNIRIMGPNTLTSADPIICTDQEKIKKTMNATFITRISGLNNKSASAAILKLILLFTCLHFRSV